MSNCVSFKESSMGLSDSYITKIIDIIIKRALKRGQLLFSLSIKPVAPTAPLSKNQCLHSPVLPLLTKPVSLLRMFLLLQKKMIKLQHRFSSKSNTDWWYDQYKHFSDLDIFIWVFTSLSTLQVISWQAVGMEEETSTYSWSRLCTVNCRPMASNYQLSHLRLGWETNFDVRGGRPECSHSITMAPFFGPRRKYDSWKKYQRQVFGIV